MVELGKLEGEQWRSSVLLWSFSPFGSSLHCYSIKAVFVGSAGENLTREETRG